MVPLLRVFDMLQYFEKILPLVESLSSSQQDEVYQWVVALLEACDVTNNGGHLGRHLGFYQELELEFKKNREKWQFFVLDLEINT